MISSSVWALHVTPAAACVRSVSLCVAPNVQHRKPQTDFLKTTVHMRSVAVLLIAALAFAAAADVRAACRGWSPAAVPCSDRRLTAQSARMGPQPVCATTHSL